MIVPGVKIKDIGLDHTKLLLILLDLLDETRGQSDPKEFLEPLKENSHVHSVTEITWVITLYRGLAKERNACHTFGWSNQFLSMPTKQDLNLFSISTFIVFDQKSVEAWLARMLWTEEVRKRKK